MIRKYKYYPAAILIISAILFSCYAKERELYGSWESILIENRSSFFAKTLPSSVKGEVLLAFMHDKTFRWINETEKLNLSGKYSSEGNKIIFNINGEMKPLEVEFKFQNDKLIIITDDGFSFTFVKKIK